MQALVPNDDTTIEVNLALPKEKDGPQGLLQ
jgi:hypothetical protein